MRYRGGAMGVTLPQSWKNHGNSRILKFSEISGKIMEFGQKLGKVIEKSCNLEITARSHRKIMEFDNQFLHFNKLVLLGSNHSNWIIFC